MLMYFGWADPALNAQMGVDYYESVLTRMGAQTKDFFRLFMMPGVFHCGGGPGCDQFPRLKTLIDWVEKAAAPQRIVASKMAGGKTVRSRPLCVYPQVARYKGTGSVDEEANFACVNAN
jgi:feruloyl esterase